MNIKKPQHRYSKDIIKTNMKKKLLYCLMLLILSIGAYSQTDSDFPEYESPTYTETFITELILGIDGVVIGSSEDDGMTMLVAIVDEFCELNDIKLYVYELANLHDGVELIWPWQLRDNNYYCACEVCGKLLVISYYPEESFLIFYYARGL